MKDEDYNPLPHLSSLARAGASLLDCINPPLPATAAVGEVMLCTGDLRLPKLRAASMRLPVVRVLERCVDQRKGIILEVMTKELVEERRVVLNNPSEVVIIDVIEGFVLVESQVRCRTDRVV